jgi:predicted glycogen debranching enzyme
MYNLIRHMMFTPQEYLQCSLDPHAESEKFLRSEWLVTNGLGGYASSSISGITTRKYHGLLVAALPPPFGRTVMLNHLSEQVMFPDGQRFWLGCEERSDADIHLEGMKYLREFRLEAGLPVWIFEIENVMIEKRILLTHLQNTLHILYRLISGTIPIRLRLQPSVHFRPHEAPVNTLIDEPYVITAIDDHYQLSTKNFPPLRLKIEGQRARFTLESRLIRNTFFRIESKRGYESVGDLWSPGFFKVELSPEKFATLIASTESWEMIQALPSHEVLNAERERRNQLVYTAPPVARTGFGGELVLAADQFIITPASRIEDAARAHAAGAEIRTIIAGYHWFTDWGRDTMISLEGLTLDTGRYNEAGWILRTFNHYVRDGLIPNMFPEGQKEGLYHTADATLWFFHAIDRYVEVTGDRETLRLILTTLLNIVYHHLRGTRFGIGVDPQDGLLHQGAEGFQLTWMDAKVGDWVVTPRRGKAVEINALWYNALRLLENWLREEKGEAAAESIREQADKAYQSFNQRFWYAEGGYLYDVVDGEGGKDDLACRPNQLFAISLKHPILDPKHWNSVVAVVQERLLTPYGLRSLDPRHSDYKSRYDGDLRSRDAAYHQGTVWAWLIGPFIDAWIKVHPEDREGARRFLTGFEAHLGDAGIGSISEVFDAIDPFTPRGCIAQAWSVAEVLRCWVKTAPAEEEKK